jgi:hypothetical protein
MKNVASIQKAILLPATGTPAGLTTCALCEGLMMILLLESKNECSIIGHVLEARSVFFSGGGLDTRRFVGGVQTGNLG